VAGEWVARVHAPPTFSGAFRLISRQIVAAYLHSLVGREELTALRERTKRQHGKTASATQPRTNRHAPQWAFAEVQSFII
jgi:hypothetical protein